MATKPHGTSGKLTGGARSEGADVWSVSGIHPEDREMAEAQARRSGISLGDWLNRAILEQISLETSTMVSELEHLEALAARTTTILNPSIDQNVSWTISAPEADLLGSTGVAESARLSAIWTRVSELLGGPKILRRDVEGPLEAHDLIQAGLPARALTHLVDHVRLLRSSDQFEKAV
ncbi:MAG: hypothetical protein Q7T09_07505, partial [Phenylobacterium sp.]|nr:hypothetical protein [Phenylobacterium sp.]